MEFFQPGKTWENLGKRPLKFCGNPDVCCGDGLVVKVQMSLNTFLG